MHGCDFNFTKPGSQGRCGNPPLRGSNKQPLLEGLKLKSLTVGLGEREDRKQDGKAEQGPAYDTFLLSSGLNHGNLELCHLGFGRRKWFCAFAWVFSSICWGLSLASQHGNKSRNNRESARFLRGRTLCCLLQSAPECPSDLAHVTSRALDPLSLYMST